MRALKTQPYGFLIKPFRERELYSNIEMAIHKHRVLKKRNRAADVIPASPAVAPEVRLPPDYFRDKEPVVVGTDTEHLKNLVFESLENPVFVVNSKLKIVLYNRKFAELCAFFNISESTFRASAEKAGVFPLFGASNEFFTIFSGGGANSSTLEVMRGEIKYSLKVSRKPIKEGHDVVNVIALIDDVTYEKMLEESGELYHKTAEGIIELSNELKHALKANDDPRLDEIADASDDLVLDFTKTDEEWLKVREMENLRKLWDR
jgi:hypothetical protein